MSKSVVLSMLVILAPGCYAPDEYAAVREAHRDLLDYEPPPKLLCDFTDRAALLWAAARDAMLHGSHTDHDAMLCESHLTGITWMAVLPDGPGEGIAVLRAGTGTYARRTCRPWRPADSRTVRCEEEGERVASRCVESGGLAMGPRGYLMARVCMSSDSGGAHESRRFPLRAPRCREDTKGAAVTPRLPCPAARVLARYLNSLP